MLYRLEQRIHTLAQNCVGRASTPAPEFTTDGVTFSCWLVKESDEWLTHDYWLATTEIDANGYIEAWQIFWKKLAKIVPRICLVSQCYMEYLGQPILILRKDIGVAFVRWVGDRPGAGLMFMDKQHEALELLLKDAEIPDEFFYYWNDATNSTGYAAKLVLMFSAVEVLAKIKQGKMQGKKTNEEKKMFYGELERILGPELKKELYGTKDDSDSKLRNRLIHGEYFQLEDGQKDNWLILHQRIITYFNDSIFKHKLIHEDVDNPQRHPFGNRDHSRPFLKPTGNAKLKLIDVVTAIDKGGLDTFADYEVLRSDDYENSF